MDEVEISTIVYVPPEEVYTFLIDFEGYAKYSEYVNSVRANGSGNVGTEYGIEFGWWKITYTSWSKVTKMEENSAIEWEITKDVDAGGGWYLEEVDVDEYDSIPDTVDTATRVTVSSEFDLSSTGPSALDLPMLVSFDWVIDKVKPKILEEASIVLERVVEDVEGERREPKIFVHETPDSINITADDLNVTGK